MIGQKISHYKVIEKLGGGGMGVVYKAEDVTLERTIALKLLPPELALDENWRSRFILEARAASAMDHPNICTIHEIDETAEGQLFICMPFYEGETVKRKIARGPLPVQDAIDIATGVVNGLVNAHSSGIVHRDIKPANIMVTNDGVVKIVDFGVAKLTGMEEVAKTGTILGTTPYMSPEQATGKEVDQRTDIWSFGVLLYEMLSGHLPFTADHEQALTYLILHENPEPLDTLRSDVPTALRRIVARSLEKDPVNRYQRVEEILEELKSPVASVVSTTEKRPSIVVLPFTDISPGKDNEYFSDGLTEQIITDLSQIRTLRVISCTSAMKLKGTNKSAKTIGAELDVQYLLEGSVRKVENSLRINAQLIDVARDSNLWAEKYSGTLADVFDIQERVSNSIVNLLKLKLSREEALRIAEHPIDNIRAFECYLRARQEVMRFTEEGLNRALQYLQQAVEVVGENAVLNAGIGYVYWQYVNLGIKPPKEYLSKAEANAAKVFEKEAGSARGHMLLGLINMTKGDTQECVRHLMQTLAADPNDPDALFWLIINLGMAGRTSIVKQYVERLLEVDPLTPINHGTPGYVLLCEGRFDLALETVERYYKLEPDIAISRFWYAWLLAQNKRHNEACSLFDIAAKDTPGELWARLGLCFKYALRGELETLRSQSQGVAAIAKWDLQYSWFLSECYALVNDKVEAFRWLDNSVRRGFLNYPMVRTFDTFLDNLRGEEHFEKLVERVKYGWERFDVRA
jgi:serine/threonine protein kinase